MADNEIKTTPKKRSTKKGKKNLLKELMNDTESNSIIEIVQKENVIEQPNLYSLPSSVIQKQIEEKEEEEEEKEEEEKQQQQKKVIFIKKEKVQEPPQPQPVIYANKKKEESLSDIRNKINENDTNYNTIEYPISLTMEEMEEGDSLAEFLKKDSNLKQKKIQEKKRIVSTFNKPYYPQQEQQQQNSFEKTNLINEELQNKVINNKVIVIDLDKKIETPRPFSSSSSTPTLNTDNKQSIFYLFFDVSISIPNKEKQIYICFAESKSKALVLVRREIKLKYNAIVNNYVCIEMPFGIEVGIDMKKFQNPERYLKEKQKFLLNNVDSVSSNEKKNIKIFFTDNCYAAIGSHGCAFACAQNEQRAYEFIDNELFFSKDISNYKIKGIIIPDNVLSNREQELVFCIFE